MTSLTERYLAAALDGIPQGKRSDVERELRSSIADAIDDRTAAGEDPARAEVEVLEGLGDPAILSARMAGRPLWLVGPDLYLAWRRLMVLLVPVTLAIVAVVQAVLAISRDATVGEIVLQTAGGTLMVGVQLVFWVTLVFVAWERVASTDDVRTGLGLETGRWTVGRLPVPTSGRMSVTDLLTELVTNVLCIGGLLLLATIELTVDGQAVPLLAADVGSFWVPVLVAVLLALTLLQIAVYAVGRWTMTLATVNAVLGVAFAAPIVVLALQGRLLDPAFGVAIGWPDVGAADGVTMLIVAIVVVLVTGWDILDAYRKALAAERARGDASISP